MGERPEGNYGGIKVQKSSSPCDMDALKKCLEENKEKLNKCKSQFQAFKAFCMGKKPRPYTLSRRPMINPSSVTEV